MLVKTASDYTFKFLQFTFRLALISGLNKRTLQFETSIVTIQKIPWGLDSGKVAQLLNLKGNYKEEGGKEAHLSGEGQLAPVEGTGLVLHILLVIIQTSPDRLRGTVTWSFIPILDILEGNLTKM